MLGDMSGGVECVNVDCEELARRCYMVCVGGVVCYDVVCHPCVEHCD